MNRNKLNKKLVNNLILGSFLYGASDGTITAVQATQQARTPKQEALQRQSETRRRFEHRMHCGPDLSLEECIKFVQECKDATIQTGPLTLLEEAILSRSPKAVNVFVQYGADIHRVGRKVKDTYKDEFTLLHFALLSPQEMKEFCKYKNIDKVKPPPQTIFENFADMQRKSWQQLPGMAGIDTSPKEPLSDPYVSREIVEILLNSLKQSSSLLERYVNKSYTRTDQQGKTETIKPLDLAIESRDKGQRSHPELKKEIWDEYTGIIVLLLEHGAKYNEKYHARLIKEIMNMNMEKGR
jgi:hypothetical protein